MALRKKNTNLSLLFGIGIICILYGLGGSYVQGQISKIAAAISLIGLVSILICFFELRKSTKKVSLVFQWQKYGFIIFVVACLLILFSGINYLAYRCNMRWDITKTKQHTLSKETITVIKSFKEEVMVVAFYVGMPPRYLEDLFKEYTRHSQGKIKTEIIDPIAQIGYAAQFGSVISGEERKAIVIFGGERRDVDFSKQPLKENQLTNAIIQVARDKRVVYFLTGHGEYDISDDGDSGLSTLKRILVANNVEVKTLMLGIEKNIPDDCDILIVAGLSNSLAKEEEKTIKKYLEDGGDAFFLIENISSDILKKSYKKEKINELLLNDILGDWGIKIANDTVVDLSNYVGQDVGCPATRNYPPHRAIVGDLDYTFYIRPRSISILRERRKSINIAPLVLTASEKNSWGETDQALNIKFDKDLDRPGPVPIAVVIWEPKNENKSSDTRMIIFTDADFLSNAFIDKYSNAEMGLNIISWVSDLDYKIFADQKEIKVERLNLISKQKRMVAVILFVMPLLIAALGVIVWFRQRS